MGRLGTLHVLFLFIAPLFVLTGQTIEGGDGISADPSAIDAAVSYALEKVSAIRYPGPGPFPPLGATSFIRQFLESGGGTSPSRTNPIPTDWDLRATTAHSNIYVAAGQFVPQSDIDAIAATFESPIYYNVTDWFHPVSPPATVNIKIYDLGDGAGGVGGFFIPSPLTRSDLYVDSQDLRYSQTWAFEIVAHEFQHLLHYDLDANEDIWLNEGMADLAVRVSLGPGTSGIQSHIDVYESLPENDLLTWDEGQSPDYLGTIADYGRAYAFVAYLVDHFGGKDLVRSILSDGRNSLDSIDRQLEAKGYTERTWDVVSMEKGANIVDDPTYGGRVYHQGLINIKMTTMFATKNSYPYEGTITPTVRYSGYYLKFSNGDPMLGVIVNSTRAYHTAIIGTLGGTTMWSTNLTGPPSVPAFVQLSRFGELFDTLYVVPHTNVKDASITIAVERQELTPPVTTVQVSPELPDGENGYYLVPPGILLTTREGSDVLYAWNDGPFSQVSGPITAPEGTNLLRFYSSGPLTLTEEERNMTFHVDTMDPVTVSNVDPPSPDGTDGYYITPPTLYFSRSDPLDKVYYDIGTGITVYDAPFDLTGGVWTVKYWGEDESGRKERERSFEIKVDVSDPKVDLTIYPLEPTGKLGYYIERPIITLTSEIGNSIYYSLSADSYQLYSGPLELGDGAWDLRYYSESPSGRTGSIGAETFRVDATPPDLDVEFDPPLSGGWNNANTYMTITLTKDGDRAFFMLGEQGPFPYNAPYLLTDGTYDITYWAEDDAGNLAPKESMSVMVDITTPVTRIVFDRDPDNNIWFYDRSPVVDFMPSFTPVSEETSYYSIEGGPFIEFTGGDLDLRPGISTIEYYSIDLAGNRETTRRWEIGLDITRPEPAVRVNRTLIPVRGPVRFDLSGSSDDNGIYRYRVDFGDGSESGWIYENKAIHNYDRLGKFKVQVSVEDTSGRMSVRMASVTIEVLSQKDYDERLEQDYTGTLIAIVASLLILIAVLGTGLLVLLRARANREHEDQEVVFELDEENK
ncbi:MAG: PKD domain-containing protein [Candidatus Thermoplasmatota archaeon]|jgi:hypothetical protein|nr:PKD domain-containing protein [Candidatus Thermoplasmatota archaeon]